MRKHNFEIGEYYHIYNRGVDKRDIFLDLEYYERFLLGLKEFNSDRLKELSKINIERKSDSLSGKERVDKEIVDIIAYALMPNHFHLLIRESKENGITQFMRKLGTGYTNYINKKLERTGVLFEGKFKSVHIDKDEYLRHLFVYIHINPLDLLEPGWKEKGVGDINKTMKFLEDYKWSSYKNYLKNNFSDGIISNEKLPNYWGNSKEMESFIENWMNKEIEFVPDIILE